MSAMATESTYVYIPNLVGRQMLRIPAVSMDDELEVEQVQVPDATPSMTMDTTTIKSANLIRRDSSLTVSVESVSESE